MFYKVRAKIIESWNSDPGHPFRNSLQIDKSVMPVSSSRMITHNSGRCRYAGMFPRVSSDGPVSPQHSIDYKTAILMLF